MSDKRMMIMPAAVIKRIDDNRGDMSQAEFIEFLINTQLQETKEKPEEQQYVTREEFRTFADDVKNLIKRALDFFVSYGLEIGKQSPKTEFEELTSRLHELEGDLSSGDDRKEAKIKWK